MRMRTLLLDDVVGEAHAVIVLTEGGRLVDNAGTALAGDVLVAHDVKCLVSVLRKKKRVSGESSEEEEEKEANKAFRQSNYDIIESLTWESPKTGPIAYR